MRSASARRATFAAHRPASASRTSAPRSTPSSQKSCQLNANSLLVGEMRGEMRVERRGEERRSKPVEHFGRFGLGRLAALQADRDECEVVGLDLLGMPEVAGIAADLLEEALELLRVRLLERLARLAAPLDQQPRRAYLRPEAELRIDRLR